MLILKTSIPEQLYKAIKGHFFFCSGSFLTDTNDFSHFETLALKNTFPMVSMFVFLQNL